MMFPRRPDYKTLTTAGALGNTYSLQISREFWLECITLKVAVTVSGVMATACPDAILNLVKKVRMSITDATGNRKVIDCNGPALLEYWKNVNWSLDRGTAAAVGGNGTNTYYMFYPIPFRHVQLGDPYGAATMLPLPRLSNDPVLEVDIASQADMDFNASKTFAISALRIDACLGRRDVLIPNFPYIPCELITYEKQWNAAGGKQDFEIPAIGTVTGILCQDYVGGTSRSTNLAAETEDWSIEYLSTIIRRQQARMIQAENDWSVQNYPATWLNFAGYYWDFLTDYAGTDAFNVGSCLDLNPLQLNGGKARIIGSNLTTTASSFTRFTVHKMFGDLRALKFV